MKIVIVGAGWTGLTAGYRLLQAGHEVIIVERDEQVGGLAGSFKMNRWQWSLEKFYHHWFANDKYALELAAELGQKVITLTPKTDIWYRGKSIPFDSPIAVLSAPFLSPLSKVRVGVLTLFLKYFVNGDRLATKLAVPWLEKYMGKEVTQVVWKPLMNSKFGKYSKTVSMSWFCARIKKRTQNLVYPLGGFASMSKKLIATITDRGGNILLNEKVISIKYRNNKCLIKTSARMIKADKVLVTTPMSSLTKLCPTLPKSILKKIRTIKHLSAQVLILILKKPLMNETYWLNVTDKNYPFLGVVEQTNFIDKSYYGNQHVVYLGNYLPNDHPYLAYSAEHLLEIFTPFINKINSDFRKDLIEITKWQAQDAQQVVDTKYLNRLPSYKLPIPNTFVANLDMIYPWDRGTNYAISEGEKVARLINQDS